MRLRLSSLILIVLACVCMASSAFAGGIEASTYIAKDDANLIAIVNASNASINTPLLSYDGKTGVVSFDFTTFNKLPDDVKSAFMDTSLSTVNKSGLGAQRKSKLFAFIARQNGSISSAISHLKSDASADFYTGISWLEPFSSPFSTFLGFLALVILSLGTVSVVFDLSALTIPFFQVASLEKGLISRFVSAQAREALRQQEATGKSALVIWFRKRVAVLLFLSVALMYLITGSIYDVMGWFLSFGEIH